MNLGVVGYLISLSNLQAFGGPNSRVKDMSIQVADVGTLAGYLKDYPQCSIEHFRGTSYCRVGNVGRYVSNTLRRYLLENVGLGEEGVLLTILFKDPNESSDDSEGDNFSHILLRKHGLKEDEVHQVIDQYLSNLQKGNRGRN